MWVVVTAVWLVMVGTFLVAIDAPWRHESVAALRPEDKGYYAELLLGGGQKMPAPEQSSFLDEIRFYGIAAIAPPALIFALGLVGLWVARGFQRES